MSIKRLIKSLHKRTNRFFLRGLSRRVKAGHIRPLSIDNEGIWFKTQYGFGVYSNLHDRILELDVNPVWEKMESKFIIDNVHENSVFIDIGANIGYFSLLAAHLKARKVLSLEPVPNTYQMLKKNISHNGFTDIIEPMNIALGDMDGIVKFTSAFGPKNHLQNDKYDVSRNTPLVDVRIAVLDNILKNREDIKKIDFIKMDVEGGEYGALSGARVTLKTHKPMVLIEIAEHLLSRYNTTPQQIFSFMAELGYNFLCFKGDSIYPGTKDGKIVCKDYLFYTEEHRPIY
jgi:FkbM family methyltransferase